ncbi:MAG: DUF3365 domain-containing protein [Gemmatimonadales bacterium]|nr:MAG: DUF3365 domain-containing protein [Gemmatimonadales bacterium]
MKILHPPTVLLALLLAASACSDAAEPEAEAGPPVRPDTLPTEIQAEVESRGSAAADALAQGLVGRLAEAIDEQGTVGAVDFCSAEAMELTRDIAEDHDASLELKRTTTRWRNPDNAPDEAEARVLEYLEALEAREPGSAPAALTAAGPDGSPRFYRALRTAPMCLQCHGAEADLDPEVRRILEARYPEDRAVGYSEGEFRGVIRVSFPADSASP